jgi:hypothetical protein
MARTKKPSAPILPRGKPLAPPKVKVKAKLKPKPKKRGKK